MTADFTPLVRFEEIGRPDMPRVYGKNAFLEEMVGKLAAKGVKVPPGFATTADSYWRFVEANVLAIGIAVHCDGCVAEHTKMAHEHGASREEVAETAALALYMGGGSGAVYGADALRAYEQFAAGDPTG
jgi:AhpD family alkylhydroperoxidase